MLSNGESLELRSQMGGLRPVGRQALFVQRSCRSEMTLHVFGQGGHLLVRLQAHLSQQPPACLGHTYFIGLAGQ